MIKKVIFFSSIILSLNGCQTHLPVVTESISCDENVERIKLHDTDYLLYANTMIDSLAQDEKVQEKTENSRMQLYLDAVVNKTNEIIKMTSINAAIKNRIIRSGQFILVNQEDSARYHLSGLIENVQDTRNCSVEYQQFSLKLMDMRSNSIIWSEEKRIK